MSDQTKKILGLVFALLVIGGLAYFAYSSWQQSAKNTSAINEQAKRIEGIQGEETITARELLDKLSESMGKSKDITINI